MELTLHTGFPGDRTKININWRDENGIEYTNVLEINVESQDKPRTIKILLDGCLTEMLTPDYFSVSDNRPIKE